MTMHIHIRRTAYIPGIGHNLHEHSVRSIDEWKREQAKGHGMDWER